MDDMLWLSGIAAAKGFRDGYVTCTIESIQALVRNLHCNFSEACDLLDVPEDVRMDLALDSLAASLDEGVD